MNENLIGKLKDYFKEQDLNPEIVETHISWLILAGDYVYKMKKEVEFSFLDFSNIDSRRFYCQQEYRLNSRLAPDIYLDVLPVKSNKKGKLFIGKEEEGEIIDYTVKMMQLNNKYKMHILLEKGGVKETHVISLAEKIAHFHQKTDIIEKEYDKSFLKQRFNDISSVKEFLEKHNFHDQVKMIDHSISFSDQFIEENEEAFQKRYQDKMIRDCHGDLHSDNIFIYDDPVVFDCIEFNEDFRQIDVLNEVAFFCMDMDYLGHDNFGRLFMDNYLKIFPCIQNKEDENIFIYYKLFRANVKAKVNAIRASQAEEKKEYKEKIKASKDYMELMDRYMKELENSIK